jgi:hypothetical protein
MGAMDKAAEDERRRGASAQECYAAGTVAGELAIICTPGWEEKIGRKGHRIA